MARYYCAGAAIARSNAVRIQCAHPSQNAGLFVYFAGKFAHVLIVFFATWWHGIFNAPYLFTATLLTNYTRIRRVEAIARERELLCRCNSKFILFAPGPFGIFFVLNERASFLLIHGCNGCQLPALRAMWLLLVNITQ